MNSFASDPEDEDIFDGTCIKDIFFMEGSL